MTRKKLDTTQITNELEESAFFSKAQNPSPKKKSKQTTELPKSRSSEVPDSRRSKVPKIRTYELRNYSSLWRLDIRLTPQQKRFLSELEDKIRENMPEGEANNPKSKRITKNSIVRVFVEIFRQLNLNIDSRKFANENDLLQEVFRKLLDRVALSRSSEVPK